ncbi:unnamed protein product [Linum trigynum]|uniref:Uncharacterized protein n=1 Tax=Linum trigynum TaxID=586398 RepID=A0AAV2EN11_9ROSI
MEENCSPHSSMGWGSFYQDEVMEELRQYVLCTSELETTLLSAREEIAKRELEILRLKELLSSTTKERNDARLQCVRLMLEHKEAEEQSPPSVLLSTAAAAATAPVFSSTSTSPNEQLETHHHRGSVVEELAADRTLPEKGKLLQAVKEAGPLLQTLLLAGALPQWQHPPPQLDAVEIPPVTVASSLSSSSPAARLIHQESFNSASSPLGVKRSIDQLYDSDSASPDKKYHKIEILH